MSRDKCTKSMSEINLNACDSNDEEETSSLTSCSTTEYSRSDTPTNGTGKKGKRGRKRKNPTPVSGNFTYTCHVKEDHGTELFGVQFYNHNLGSDDHMFAVVGLHRVTIYECKPSGDLNPLQSYIDPNMVEIFYTCAWTYDDLFRPLLAVAGITGVIRIISPALGFCSRSFVGHGNAINELKFHPHEPHLLVSASKDHSLRLWNIRSQVCIAIFGGVEGHRDQVISVDIDLKGMKMVSCGMDHSLKIWRLDKEEIKEAIKKSSEYRTILTNKPFDTLDIHYPDFSTRDIHKNYVDCVMWLGHFILSKSCDNHITCWKPGKPEDRELRPNETNVSIVHKFDYKDCDIWYMRFSTDLCRETLALGNTKGKVYVWDIDTEHFTEGPTVLISPKMGKKTTVRQTSLNRDGSILVYVCNDGTVWRWDRQDPVRQKRIHDDYFTEPSP